MHVNCSMRTRVDAFSARLAVKAQVCRENHEEEDKGRKGVFAVQRLHEDRVDALEAGDAFPPHFFCCMSAVRTLRSRLTGPARSVCVTFPLTVCCRLCLIWTKRRRKRRQHMPGPRKRNRSEVGWECAQTIVHFFLTPPTRQNVHISVGAYSTRTRTRTRTCTHTHTHTRVRAHTHIRPGLERD
jgi:hypothetical protein